MSNERITEDIVRSHFKNDPLFNTIIFEEQKPLSQRIKDCLAKASKQGKGIGKPEFIITFPENHSDYSIVIECKAEGKYHKSRNLNNPKEYAVDGVLHYAKSLSKEFNVIAVAVSGQEKNKLKVSQYLCWKNTRTPNLLKDRELLSIYDYIRLFKNEYFSNDISTIDVTAKAIKLNKDFQNHSVPEKERCTIISAILLAIQNDTFRISFKTYKKPKDLGDGLIMAIKTVLSDEGIIDNRKNIMLSEYEKVRSQPLFVEERIRVNNRYIKNTILRDIIIDIEKNVYPLVKYDESGFDALGRFYTEFIRYAGSDKRQGLVLTPSHITNLFCELVDLGKNDVVYDPCAGTAGFLIAAMKKMLKEAGNNTQRKRIIKQKQLIGVEKRSDMFTYACSNMMMRGDGKSNIYHGDCFDNKLLKIIKDKKPNISFLNPPYDIGTSGQLEFIEHALSVIKSQKGMCVAIVQMSCSIDTNRKTLAVKQRILDTHTLKAVISMPNDVFHPVGVVTCVMVFEAGKPHSRTNKTWFGYLKDDGFVKRRNKGRIDTGNWREIKERLLKAYHNLEEVSGLSVKKSVSSQDEWCAEAYMETNYNKLSVEDFKRTVKDFVVFKFLNNN